MLGRILKFLIGHADTELTEMVLQEVYQRKEELFPDWEIVYVALPKKDRNKRREYLEWMLEKEIENQDVQKIITSV